MEVNKPLPVRQGRGRPVRAGVAAGQCFYSQLSQFIRFANLEAVQNPDALSGVQGCGRGRFNGRHAILDSHSSEKTPSYQN